MNFSKYLFSTLLFFVGFSLTAQDATLPKDLSKTGSRDRVVFELNWNGWANQPDSLDTKWYGRGINLYTFYDFKLGEQDFVSFGAGAGISYNNVYHRSTIAVQDIDTSATASQFATVFVPIPEGRDVKRNKLATTYVEVPLELRFRTKPDKFGKRFKVNPGIRLGYLLTGIAKYRGDDDSGAEIKYKTYLLPNINKYKISTSLRVGYGNFSLVGSFAFSSLFVKDAGPGIKPFSIGVSFNSF